MNTNIIQKEILETHYDNESCQKIYKIDGQELVNNFKCRQHTFSAADLWNVNRKARKFSLRVNL